MAFRAISLAGLATLLSITALPVHAAGLFDDLARAFFGAPQRRQVVEPYNPLSVTVKPRQQRARVKAAAVEAPSTPKPPAVQLDPSRDPYWYLKDPTMRRGDIVVTDRGVLVFQGRDADTMHRTDFSALGGSDPKGWKRKLQTAAAGGRTMFTGGPVKAKTVTAEAVEGGQVNAP